MKVTASLVIIELFTEMSVEAAVPQWHSLSCCVQYVLFQNAFFGDEGWIPAVTWETVKLSVRRKKLDAKNKQEERC